jgi:transcription initiation factor IIE alpha subunit
VRNITQKNQTKIEERKDDAKFPYFGCPKCRVKVQLDFDPLKCPLEWHLFKCPSCGYHNGNDDYIIIEQIKLTFILEEG